LPAYLGGKRRLAPLIFGLLQEVVPTNRWPGLTFIDPFLGGGSVSLLAKRHGFRVACNDIALRSAAIGRALIENSTVRLSEGDIIALLRQPDEPYPTVATERYYPSVLPRAHAALLDRCLDNLRSFSEPRRSLAILLLVKWTLRIQPMSSLTGTDARAAFAGDLDRVSSRRLGHYLKRDRLLGPTAWRELVCQVNAGVFPGEGRAYQQDALTFLRDTQGDVVYLDPPYPGTTSYEKEYAALDDLLEGTTRPVSGYSRSADLLNDLFAACRHIPVWLISLNNSALSLGELEGLVRRHRSSVRDLEVPYCHLESLASEKKNEGNREHIVLATD
jgi:adenine-specific DNA-methyltransferase